MTGLPLYLEIFDNLGKKNLKFLTIKKDVQQKNFALTQKKTILQIRFFWDSSKTFFIKNIFKVVLQYLFNVFIQFDIVFNLRLLKIDQKCAYLKTWKKYGKPGKNLDKMSGNPVYQKTHLNQYHSMFSLYFYDF